jgi:hypothetical protein
MMAFLLTCCEALDVEALGPAFLAVLPAGAGVSMGMGASVVVED